MKNEAKSLINTLRNIEKKYSNENFSGMIAGGYALWLARSNGLIDVDDIKKFLATYEDNIEIQMFLNEQLGGHWNEYRRYITMFEPGELKEAVLTITPVSSRSYMTGTAKGILELVCAILDLKENDSIADWGAGIGEFICHAFSQVPKAHFWGDEVGTTASSIAKIKAKLLGGDIQIEQEDMFLPKKASLPAFDKAFCFPPFGLRLGGMPNVQKFLETFPSLPLIKGACACEWIFALKMLSKMKSGGKSVLLMANGGTFNSLDAPIRKYFIERGMIECVIALPGRILNFTNIPCSLVVFSKDNKKIKLIDATSLGHVGRHQTEFSPVDIQKILEVYRGKKADWCADIPNEQILANDSVINAARYTSEKIDIKHQVPFGTVIQSITRGAMLPSADLETMTSEKPTPFQYLALGNIKDGIIDDELPYLASVDERWLRYSLKPGDLILSKIGSPFKVAIANPQEKTSVIANGNLFIIRINEKVADPYYIKAFLESETGMALLQRSAVGSAMPNLSAKAIMNMPISLPPLRDQKKIAAQYQAKIDEIKVLKLKLAKAVNALSHLLDL